MLSSSGALPSFPSPSWLAATMVGLRPNGSSDGQNSGDQFGHRFSDAIAQFSDCLGFVQRICDGDVLGEQESDELLILLFSQVMRFLPWNW
nr:hypothetical protein Iba_chr02fCG9080 [Ipomoea batatas]